jgi:hypothetical protein
VQGEPPSHRELLDWLARDLIEHGWNIKRLQRLILTSSTYRLASKSAARDRTVDPENRLLGHFPRRRLEGEAIRDAMLACSEQLNTRPYGPPVVPPLGKEELTGLFDSKNKWPVTRNEPEHARRSVYLLVRRTFTYPLFSVFDPPDVMTSCARRLSTVVPTQALLLLNSPVARQQATAFAQRLRAECGGSAQQAVARAWLLAFGRPVGEEESRRALAFLRERSLPRNGLRSSAAACVDALEDLCLALFNANEFTSID